MRVIDILMTDVNDKTLVLFSLNHKVKQFYPQIKTNGYTLKALLSQRRRGKVYLVCGSMRFSFCAFTHSLSGINVIYNIFSRKGAKLAEKSLFFLASFAPLRE